MHGAHTAALPSGHRVTTSCASLDWPQVPCLLPFAATFRFSPLKSGGRSDPTNHNVVLLQGQGATVEVSLESRSPHPLELLSLDIEVRRSLSFL